MVKMILCLYGYIFSCDDKMSADSEDLGEQHKNKF